LNSIEGNWKIRQAVSQSVERKTVEVKRPGGKQKEKRRPNCIGIAASKQANGLWQVRRKKSWAGMQASTAGECKAGRSDFLNDGRKKGD